MHKLIAMGLFSALVGCSQKQEVPAAYRGYFHLTDPVNAANALFFDDNTVRFSVFDCDAFGPPGNKTWVLESSGLISVDGAIITPTDGGLIVPNGTLGISNGNPVNLFWATGASCLDCRSPAQEEVACDVPWGFDGGR